MRARISNNIGVLGTVAIALAVVALYSVWGFSVLAQERAAAPAAAEVAFK